MNFSNCTQCVVEISWCYGRE